MKEEWLFHGAVVPIDVETTAALVAEIKRLIDVIGGMALAQPKQEPVTWRNAAIRVGEDLCSVGPFGYYDMTAQQWLDWALSVVTVHTPPPQRTWVDLTRAQFAEILCDDRWQGKPELMLLQAQSKLKDKNTRGQE